MDGRRISYEIHSFLESSCQFLAVGGGEAIVFSGVVISLITIDLPGDSSTPIQL